jgi:hypothetical protein
MIWRQGDIFIAVAQRVPEGAEPRPHLVLAEGEVTGHSHRVADRDSARLFAHESSLFLEVLGDRATIIHEEHGPIALTRGVYRVWRQREYSPQAIRFVAD